MAKKCRYLKNVDILWVCGRIFETILCLIYLSDKKLNIMDLKTISNGDNLSGLLLYFGYSFELLLSEFLTGIFVLDKSFLNIFRQRNSNSDKSKLFENDLSINQLLLSSNYSKDNMI